MTLIWVAFMAKLRPLLNFGLFAIPLLFTGCIHDSVVRGSTAPDIASAQNMRIGRVVAEEGIARLKQGKVEEALRIFNAGLKFEPDNPNLHFLNGLTYHISALRGDTNARALAQAGYQMTLTLDPGNFLAAIQLARLHLDGREYQKAVEAFRHALKIDPEAGDAHLGLAIAAYYDRDLATAAVAMNGAYPRLRSRADAARAAAIIYAATGDEIHSGEALSNFESLERDNSIKEAVSRRVGQWRTWRVANNAPAGASDVPTPSLGIPLAPDLAKPIQPADVAPASAPVTAPGANEPMQPRWTDCDTAPLNPQGLAASSSAGMASNAGDETTYLPPLPSPCKGRGLPRMAVFDVVIIRTEDTSGSSHGINFLDGLNLFFSYTRTTQLTGSVKQDTKVRTLSLAGATPATAILYSLNIANSSDSRSEVLARPTLIALDRQPSSFFSGRSLTLGIAGQAGGTSTLADRPIGISLSLTPTFVNDESVLVSVRAARSFLEEVNGGVNFDNSFQTSRNAVTANVLLSFGQTLILSGLTEHEIQRVSSGVPILKDIPALQYLFSKNTVQNFTSSVLVLLTPRKPVRDSEDLARSIAERESGGGVYAISAMAEDYLRMNKNATSTLDSVLWHNRSNSMYFQFRNGDLKTDDWNEGSRLDNLLRDIRQLIYF